MHIISRKKVIDSMIRHPNAKTSLNNWYRIMKRSHFASWSDLQKVFPTADIVGDFTVFNIGGNKIRLIALIFYRSQKVYVRHVLTHAEYDRGKWKE